MRLLRGSLPRCHPIESLSTEFDISKGYRAIVLTFLKLTGNKPCTNSDTIDPKKKLVINVKINGAFRIYHNLDTAPCSSGGSIMWYTKKVAKPIYAMSAMTHDSGSDYNCHTPKKCKALSLIGRVGIGAIPKTPSRMSHAAVIKMMTYNESSQYRASSTSKSHTHRSDIEW